MFNTQKLTHDLIKLSKSQYKKKTSVIPFIDDEEENKKLKQIIE